MGNIIERITSFTDEWSLLISFGLIIMFIVVILLGRGWYRSNKKHKKSLRNLRDNYDVLKNSNETHMALTRAFLRAIEGGKRFETGPDFWLKNLENLPQDEWDKYFGQEALFKFKSSLIDIGLCLKLIHNLKSAQLILAEIQEASVNGYKYFGGNDENLTFDVTRLAEDYRNMLKSAGQLLHLIGLDPYREDLIQKAELAIKSHLELGYYNQAQHLVNEMRLGTSMLDLDMVAEFVDLCTKAQLVPTDFLNPENEQHSEENLITAMEAIRLLRKQAAPPAEEAEVAEQTG